MQPGSTQRLLLLEVPHAGQQFCRWVSSGDDQPADSVRTGPEQHVGPTVTGRTVDEPAVQNVMNGRSPDADAHAALESIADTLGDVTPGLQLRSELPRAARRGRLPEVRDPISYVPRARAGIRAGTEL